VPPPDTQTCVHFPHRGHFLTSRRCEDPKRQSDRTEKVGGLRRRDTLEGTARRISGKSDLAKAIRYTLAQGTALTTVLRDGRACLHNNAAERRMRPLALGLKNYLFAGSIEGGKRAAIIHTLVGTAGLTGWDTQAYLHVLLERIADHSINRIGDLVPWNLRPSSA